MADSETLKSEDANAGLEATETALIERIYKIALEPHAYDDFMARWDEYVTTALERLTELQRDLGDKQEIAQSARVAGHFETGFRLIEELGRSSPANFFESQMKGSDLPKILLDQAGAIVWYNNAAQRALPLRRQAQFSELVQDETNRQKLIAHVESAFAKRATETCVVRIDRKEQSPLFLIASATRDRSGEDLIVLQQAASEWQPEVTQMLQDAFGLSRAETEIVQALFEGQTVNDIAASRGSALNTVRTQLKSVLAKSGARNQGGLLRLVSSLVRVAEQDTSKPRSRVSMAPHTITVRSGRRVPVHLFGPRDGSPVIFLHGMLDGCAMPQRLLDMLDGAHIQLIAPERAFFGHSEPDPGPIESAPDRLALELEDIMDSLSFRSALLVGHKAGSIWAFAAAAHLKDRVTGMVNLAGGVPLISPRQFAYMSRRQRLVAYTARYAPRLLPFVLRAGIRQLDFGGEASFMHALYEGTPADLAAIENPETYDILCQGYHFSVAQGHDAFERDSYHVVRDWTARALGSSCPVLLVHGRHDPVVACSSVVEFAQILGERADTIIDEKGGQLLLHSNSDLLIEALRRLI